MIYHTVYSKWYIIKHLLLRVNARLSPRPIKTPAEPTDPPEPKPAGFLEAQNLTLLTMRLPDLTRTIRRASGLTTIIPTGRTARVSEVPMRAELVGAFGIGSWAYLERMLIARTPFITLKS